MRDVEGEANTLFNQLWESQRALTHHKLKDKSEVVGRVDDIVQHDNVGVL